MRAVLIFGLCLGLMACGSARDLDRKPPVPLGDFELGHNIVVAPDPLKGPVSRDAEPQEWIDAVTKALGDRFGRYEGEGLYHFGVSVDGYVLAQPGIPIVLSPKSAVILNVTVWDDAAGKKLNDEPHRIIALEAISGQTVLGSGLTQSAEQQMKNLSESAAKEIERWLVGQVREEGWFAASETVEDPAAQAPLDVAEASVEAAAETATEPGVVPPELANLGTDDPVLTPPAE